MFCLATGPKFNSEQQAKQELCCSTNVTLRTIQQSLLKKIKINYYPDSEMSFYRPQTHLKHFSTYRVRAALEKHVYSSVDVSIAVVQRNHRFILVLACDVNQLREYRQTQKKRILC